jgi:CheY-like chemotaxis protein
MASNGQQAVEMYFSDRYDLIFMDLRMPVMDGFKATRLIVSTMQHPDRCTDRICI